MSGRRGIRRTSAAATVSLLAAATVLTATSPGAARTTHDRASMAGSIALFGDDPGLFHLAKNLTVNRSHKTLPIDVHESSSVVTAINPVKGNDGLLCTDEDLIFPVHGLRTTPVLQAKPIHATNYTGEGASSFGFFCEGAAVRGGFALATGDEEGLLQLVRKRGHWKIDSRVQFAGLNEAGHPHLPGWIDFKKSMTGTNDVFSGVAIAPKPQANGKYLAVALDRTDGAIVVVEGVGTAKPKPVAILTGPALLNDNFDYGNAGIAFVPKSANRAIIGTAKGFAVLSLKKPSAPRLKVATTVGDGLTSPNSLALALDGDHVAIAVGSRVYGYRNAIKAVLSGQRFIKQVSFRLGTDVNELVTDVAYTLQNKLAVIHGVDSSITGWSLTMVSKVPSGHHASGASFATTQPDEIGSLSVWPST